MCYFPAIFIFTFPCSTQQPLPNKKKAITMSCQKIYIYGSDWPSGNGSLTYSKHYCFNIGKDLFNETMSKPVETIKQKRLCPNQQSFHHNTWQSISLPEFQLFRNANKTANFSRDRPHVRFGNYLRQSLNLQCLVQTTDTKLLRQMQCSIAFQKTITSSVQFTCA